MKNKILSCIRYGALTVATLTTDDIIKILTISITILSLIIDLVKIYQNEKKGGREEVSGGGREGGSEPS